MNGKTARYSDRVVRFSLVIPAYEEEEVIEDTLVLYSDFLDKRFVAHEIIVCCEGTDDTREIARRVATEKRNIQLIWSPHPKGKGRAVLAGFLAARGELVGFVDADGSLPPEELGRIIDAIGDKYDGAIGSRRVKGSATINEPWTRRVARIFFNLLVRNLFGLHLRDTQCGAKVFKSFLVHEIAPLVRAGGFEFDVEFLWKAKSASYRIVEVPVKWNHRRRSKFSLVQGLFMLFSLVRVRRFGQIRPRKVSV